MRYQALRAVLAVAQAAALVGMAGCVAPPPAQVVNHQRIVPLSSADVWTRVHQFLQDENISVDSESAKAGIIDASRASAVNGTLAGLADCGSQLLHPVRRQSLHLTVRIKAVAEGAQVTAHAAFGETLASRRTALSVACTSTGVLEAAVLDVAGGQPMEAVVIPR